MKKQKLDTQTIKAVEEFFDQYDLGWHKDSKVICISVLTWKRFVEGKLE